MDTGHRSEADRTRGGSSMLLFSLPGRMESTRELWPPTFPAIPSLNSPGRSEKTSCRGDSPFPDALYPDGESDLPTGRKSDSASQRPSCQNRSNFARRQSSYQHTLPMPLITLKPLRDPFILASSCGPSCPTCTSGERLSLRTAYAGRSGKRCLRFRAMISIGNRATS